MNAPATKTLEVDLARRIPPDGPPADDAAFLALLRVLAHEARLLDTGEYQAWLDLLAPDILYWMPVTARRFAAAPGAQPSLHGTATFKDNLDVLRMRVQRLTSGMVWCENPANSTRHLVSNVEVYTTARADEFKVYSALLLHRSRLDSKRRQFSALREDLWRPEGTGWRLALRKITLDDSCVLDSNFNLFF